MNAPSHHPPAVRTTCPYCGVGCGVLAKPDGRGGAVIAGDPDHPANFGRLCSKGSALGETLGLETRLLHPMLRQRDGTHGARQWDDGARRASPTAFASTIARHGPDAVAFYLSGQLLTEDYYVANKLMKGFIGSANVDTNSRLCMASSVAGHRRAFGADTVPGSYARSRPRRPHYPGRLERRLVPSGAVSAHDRQQARARRQDRRHRSAPHRDRRRSRSVPADRARHGHARCSAACWCIWPTRWRSITRYIDAHTTGLAEALARAREIAPDVMATAQRAGLAGRRRAFLRTVPARPRRSSPAFRKA